tara:strand:+ start:1328 stop:1846 length:519 start_codon:yes stop_codon:yes gene_type:complete
MHDKNTIQELIKAFYPYAKRKLRFKESCKVFLHDNQENGADPLGKTAYYDPESREVHLYITKRHPKDVLKSFSHELVHHGQNCRGDLTNAGATTEGYAQTDEHLREMEREAYLEGNMLVRDWCDNNQGIEAHRGEAGMAGSIPNTNPTAKDKRWLGPAGVRGNNGKRGGWPT